MLNFSYKITIIFNEREDSVVQSIVREQLIKSALSLRFSHSFSSVAERLLPMMQTDSINSRDLAELLKCDPVMAARIISIANSAYYSRGTHVYSLNQAILNIGLNEVKNILICMVFVNAILKGSRLKKEDLLFMWTHSLFVASSARTLCKRFMIDDPEKVFTVSLFHDIGKIVFFMNIDWYRESIEEAIRRKIPLNTIETERYGITHNEIGYILAERWKFPDAFGFVIKNHRLTLYEGKRSSPSEILNMVNAANTFFYFRDIPDFPYGYVLKNESENIQQEVRKFIEIVNSGIE